MLVQRPRTPFVVRQLCVGTNHAQDWSMKGRQAMAGYIETIQDVIDLIEEYDTKNKDKDLYDARFPEALSILNMLNRMSSQLQVTEWTVQEAITGRRYSHFYVEGIVDGSPVKDGPFKTERIAKDHILFKVTGG